MRVCILTTSFPLYKGITIGTHVIEQARHLVKAGVEVLVIAPHHQGAPRYEFVDGISVYRYRYMWPEKLQTLCYGAGIPANLKSSLWAKIQLPFLLLMIFLNTLKLARESDLIHAHWTLSGLAGVLSGKLMKKPVIVMLHHGISSLKGKPVIRFVLEHADHVICNSSYTKAKVLDATRLEDCMVIPPGVDIQRFRPDADLSYFNKKTQDIPERCPIILSLGRFIELKGFNYLIDAMGLLDCEPEPYLIIGGRGHLEEKLRRQVQDNGLINKVKFAGNIPFDNIHQYHAAADLFILPSVVDQDGNTEGLGVVLLEALACGTPCIASNVGGIPDIIKDGINGFLVGPGNSRELAGRITQLISDDKLRISMGEQGRLFVEKHFAWQEKASDLIRLYQDVIEG